MFATGGKIFGNFRKNLKQTVESTLIALSLKIMWAIHFLYPEYLVTVLVPRSTAWLF